MPRQVVFQIRPLERLVGGGPRIDQVDVIQIETEQREGDDETEQSNGYDDVVPQKKVLLNNQWEARFEITYIHTYIDRLIERDGERDIERWHNFFFILYKAAITK